MKLDLWKVQLEKGDTYHFSNLQSVREGANFSEYVKVIEALIEEFSHRFQELLQLKPTFHLFVKPFSIPVVEVPHDFQMELINLQSSTRLKDIFYSADSLQGFYKRLPQQQYPKLHKQAAQILSMFGDTYVVETFFSALKLTKSKFRSQISDDNLRNSLRLNASQTIVPDIERIINMKANED